LATATLDETAGHPEQQEPRATARSDLNSEEWRAVGSLEQIDPVHLGVDRPGNRGSWEERGRNTIGSWEENRGRLEMPARWVAHGLNFFL
jgi:hypothetical protein